MSDEQILASHDTQAFGVFYDRHAGALLGYFARRTGDAQAAADLTAETFASAISAQDRYVPTSRRRPRGSIRSRPGGWPTTTGGAR